VLESFDDWSNLVFARPGIERLNRPSGDPLTVPLQETSSLDDLLEQAAQTLGDTKAPRLRLERRGRTAIVTASDGKRVDRLVVGAGHRLRSSPPTKAARRLRVTVRLKRGTTRVVARAMDWAGNQSRPLSRTVRVR
jgi:glycine/D-amino acid oxidase-like deaminating enzyme